MTYLYGSIRTSKRRRGAVARAPCKSSEMSGQSEMSDFLSALFLVYMDCTYWCTCTVPVLNIFQHRLIINEDTIDLIDNITDKTNKIMPNGMLYTNTKIKQFSIYSIKLYCVYEYSTVQFSRLSMLHWEKYSRVQYIRTKFIQIFIISLQYIYREDGRTL